MRIFFSINSNFFILSTDDQHEDIIVEYGQAVTLECNTYDTEYHYVEWYRNDSRIAVIQQLEDYKPVVSTNYTDRAELRKKDLHIKHVKFEDAASYVCRIAVRKEEKQVSVQHGTFWKLIVKHEGLRYRPKAGAASFTVGGRCEVVGGRGLPAS